jgi:hypothetical protein
MLERVWYIRYYLTFPDSEPFKTMFEKIVEYLFYSINSKPKTLMYIEFNPSQYVHIYPYISLKSLNVHLCACITHTYFYAPLNPGTAHVCWLFRTFAGVRTETGFKFCLFWRRSSCSLPRTNTWNNRIQCFKQWSKKWNF